jgi:hypothetical protein
MKVKLKSPVEESRPRAEIPVGEKKFKWAKGFIMGYGHGHVILK